MRLDEARSLVPEAEIVGSGEPLPQPADAAAISLIHKHCAVFTRSEVACAILDLIGWRADGDLTGQRLLEPACGEGAFLLPAIERLLASARMFGRPLDDTLADQILAFEFDAATAKIARDKVVALLRKLGVILARS